MGGEPVKLPFLEHVALWALPRFENPGTLQCVPLTILCQPRTTTFGCDACSRQDLQLRDLLTSRPMNSP